MREDEIYIATKKWFKSNHFEIIGGQPPNGSDNIPVIEIKDRFIKEKGSKGAYKPDLIAINNNILVIIECKPLDSKSDEKKLLDIINSEIKKKLLFDELIKRGIVERYKDIEYLNSYEIFKDKLRYCLSHNGTIRKMNYISCLYIKNIDGEGEIFEPLNSNGLFK